MTIKTDWRRHETRGWVCVHCGHHALWNVSRRVHHRRALRGLDCVQRAS